MGAGWCPPGMLGIGIGGTAEKAMLLAKQALMDDDRHARAEGARPAQQARGVAHRDSATRSTRWASARRGWVGLTTVLDVKIAMQATHAAGKPVAMIPNCAATRHAHFVLDGSGPAYLERAQLVELARRAVGARLQAAHPRRSRHADAAEVATWKPGDRLLLNGKMLTGRDAAHKRIAGHAREGRAAAGRASPTASSIMSARSIRSARKSSARPARRPRRGWTSSRA